MIRHVYNSCESAVDNGQGYGWRLSSMQRLEKTAIEKYPYVYTDEDGTRHYFYKDDTDGNKLKDEDGLGLVITVESGKDDKYAMIMETKDKIRYIFARDGSLRFVKDPDENQVAYVYRQINGKKCLDYIEDGTGSRIRIQYGTSGVAERVAAIQDAAGRWLGKTFHDIHPEKVREDYCRSRHQSGSWNTLGKWYAAGGRRGREQIKSDYEYRI